MLVYLYAVFAVLLGVFGQLFLKMGASNLSLFQAVLRPYTWLGFFLYGVSSLFWLLILSRMPLSTAYPILAMNFVLIAFISVVFLGEIVNTTKIIGTLLIVAGVIVINR